MGIKQAAARITAGTSVRVSLACAHLRHVPKARAEEESLKVSGRPASVLAAPLNTEREKAQLERRLHRDWAQTPCRFPCQAGVQHVSTFDVGGVTLGSCVGMFVPTDVLIESSIDFDWDGRPRGGNWDSRGYLRKEDDTTDVMSQVFGGDVA